ncbi:amidohydrolase [Membranihabitans maritimus]|uniref:amidohydrolase n=1 Tax=Membranihabitans maritimus TaxID=2904244 RepID=UPI001F00E800|nr:amidohydrolase [Membranihabitans maritimus]
MKIYILCLLVFLGNLMVAQESENEKKQFVIKGINDQFPELRELSDKIWSYEEEAFQEIRSSEALVDYARKNGFKITENIGGMPTAFTAEYGSGHPVIGILGEFDALPGLSQKTVPYKDPLNTGNPGHGCGHNLFGTASLGAAVALKKLLERGELQGTIRFYGTPAEEKYFGKLWMIRAGAFEDVDVVLDWHPSGETKVAVQKGLALVDFIVEFYGQAAHASGDPWNGRSASDAMELYAAGINTFREHIRPTVRIHYHMQQAGDVVNVVPDYARIWTRVRDTRRAGMEEVWKHVEEMARGASIMTKTDYKISLVSGVHEILVNRTGSEAMQKNLEFLGPIIYTEEEQNFAKKIQKATAKEELGMESVITPLEETLEHPMGGSTDVGDVSWVVPVVSIRTKKKLTYKLINNIDS